MSADGWLWFLDHLEAEHRTTLTAWEVEFVDSMREQIAARRSMSKKQEQTLTRMKARCRCEGVVE